MLTSGLLIKKLAVIPLVPVPVESEEKQPVSALHCFA